MVYINSAPVIIIERDTRRAVRAPVCVLDGGRVVVIVIVMLHQVDVRRRQHRREQSRGDERRGSKRPAETGGNHEDGRILT